jgi:hypothetical protein
MRQHVVASVPKLVESTPPQLRSVLTGLLAKHRELRFDSAAAALEAFGQVGRALARDSTPWIPLLQDRAPDKPRATPQTDELGAVDHALRRLLADRTPIAESRLLEGIGVVSQPRTLGWEFPSGELVLSDLDPWRKF